MAIVYNFIPLILVCKYFEDRDNILHFLSMMFATLILINSLSRLLGGG